MQVTRFRSHPSVNVSCTLCIFHKTNFHNMLTSSKQKMHTNLDKLTLYLYLMYFLYVLSTIITCQSLVDSSAISKSAKICNNLRNMICWHNTSPYQNAGVTFPLKQLKHIRDNFLMVLCLNKPFFLSISQGLIHWKHVSDLAFLQNTMLQSWFSMATFSIWRMLLIETCAWECELSNLKLSTVLTYTWKRKLPSRISFVNQP